MGEPPPAADTLTIELQRDGALSCEATPHTLTELRRRLRLEADKRTKTRIGSFESSDMNVLLAADRDVPFGAVSKVLWEVSKCAHKVFYAVRHEDTAEPGALALFLPSGEGDDRQGLHVPVRVVVGLDQMPSNPATLHHHVRAFLRTDHFGHPILCEATYDVPFGFVLQVVDSILRAGSDHVAISGTMTRVKAMDGEHLQDFVREIGTVQRAPSIRWQDQLLDCSAESIPARAMVRGRFAGLTETIRVHSHDEPDALEPPESNSQKGR